MIICILITAFGVCFLHGWFQHHQEQPQYFGDEDSSNLLTGTNTDIYSSSVSNTNPSDALSQPFSPLFPTDQQPASLPMKTKIVFDDGTF